MSLALIEIRRSLGRFLLLTAAVGLLVLLLLFFQAVAGTLTGGLTGAYENGASDVLVYDARARQNPLASVLDPATAEAVAAVEGVAAAAPIGITAASAETAAEEVDVTLVGADADAPAGPLELADGRRATAQGEAVASGGLGDATAVGDRVVVAGRELEVVGTADDAALNVGLTLYVPFATYEAVVQDRAGAAVDVPASAIGVALADGADPVAVAAAITAAVEGVEALDRDAAVAALPGVDQVTRSFSILYLLLYVVVTIVTGVFFLILTVQKAEALVLLRAVGARRADVVRPVLTQVALVTGVGAVIGAAAAAGLLAAARDVFGAGLSPGTAVTTVLAILALGLLASFGAVRRVLRIDPASAVVGGGLA